METLTPDRLQSVRLDKILQELTLELGKQRPNLNVRDKKSVYGRVYHKITHYESTLSERKYLRALTTQYLKVIQTQLYYSFTKLKKNNILLTNLRYLHNEGKHYESCETNCSGKEEE